MKHKIIRTIEKISSDYLYGQERISTIAPSKHFAFRGHGLSFLGKQS
ncbi:hypothetical protein [Halobacillus hunanensis]|nr:hypothetical protein [Halobacillus hunanensis]